MSRSSSTPCATAEPNQVVLLLDNRGRRQWCLLSRTSSRLATRERGCTTVIALYPPGTPPPTGTSLEHSYDRAVTNLPPAILLPRRCSSQSRRVGYLITLCKAMYHTTPQETAETYSPPSVSTLATCSAIQTKNVVAMRHTAQSYHYSAVTAGTLTHHSSRASSDHDGPTSASPLVASSVWLIRAITSWGKGFTADAAILLRWRIWMASVTGSFCTPAPNASIAFLSAMFSTHSSGCSRTCTTVFMDMRPRGSLLSIIARSFRTCGDST